MRLSSKRNSSLTESFHPSLQAFNIVAGVGIGVWAFVLLVAAYLCVIVGRYRDQLRDERGGFRKVHASDMGETGGYYRQYPTPGYRH